jgi:chromosome partitioning protein
MRTILVLNAKGGSGKTTIATSLAAYYAGRGRQVSLVDLDPQASSIDWLAARDPELPAIHGVEGWHGRIRHPRGTQVAVFDGRAGVHGPELAALLRRAETLLMPVLPSALDMRAAQRFLGEVLGLAPVTRGRIRVGTVINRARETSPGRVELEAFLRGLRQPNGRRLPMVGVLRGTQAYVRAAEAGLGIHELPPSMVSHDLELWRPVLRWLASRGSRPR